ncbi:hypothetical protein F5884DRAFT_180758 [Xylogone sp. PMI_703]|nr:hypothetical protein F5884DRAFT_180758 [Xylogone sp. PMI_703]
MENTSESSAPNKNQRSDASTAPRKRMRYVAQACDQCKRQKVRCNGQKPCNRCERLRPKECHYQGDQHAYNCAECGRSRREASVDDIKTSQLNNNSHPDSPSNNPDAIANLLETLKAQSGKLDILLERTTIFKTQVAAGTSSAPILDSSSMSPSQQTQEVSETKAQTPTARLHPEPPPIPTFHGPTSSSYLIDLALMIVNQRGKNKDSGQPTAEIEGLVRSSISDDEAIDCSQDAVENESTDSVPVHPESFALTEGGRKLSLDPLQKLDLDEVTRLLRLYDDLIQAQYPFLEMELLIQQTQELYVLLQSPSVPYDNTTTPMIGMDIDGVRILKLVLAIALVLDGKDNASLANTLYKSLESHVRDKMWGGVSNVKGLVLVVLVGLYHFYNNDVQMACRITGSMARLALELGLHRHGTLLHLNNSQGLTNPLNTFWTIFIFDRQWNFAVGLPVVINNIDIDPEVPEPANPYLRMMIRYARIGDKAWESLSRSVSDRLNGARTAHDFRTAYETLDYHQFQLDQWQKSIPDELSFSYTDYTSIRKTMLRTILRLRANQMRIIMIRPFLFSTAGSEARLREAMSAIDVASDTIQILVNLRARNNLYRLQQALFNHFLVAAIGMLYLLVIRHSVQGSSSSTTSYRLTAPTLASARAGLFHGLDILRTLGSSATTPKRLWNKLFPVLSQLGRSIDKLPAASSYPPEALYRFPDTTYDSDLLNYQFDFDPNQAMVGVSMTYPAAPQNQLPDLSQEFFNMIDTEGVAVIDDMFKDKDYSHYFETPVPPNGAALDPDLQAVFPDNPRINTNWQKF